MKRIRTELKARLREVDTYIAFLREVEKNEDQGWANFLKVGSDQEIVDRGSLEQVLKSTTYLLMYNLIESTVNSTFKVVSNAISQLKTYRGLNKKIQSLMVRSFLLLPQKKDDSKDVSVPSYMDHGTVVQRMLNFLESVVMDDACPIHTKVLKGSGNLDAYQIKKLMETLGIVGYKDKNKYYVKAIKDNRNDLAHGDKSFSSIGSQMTIQSIYLMRKEMIYVIVKFVRRIEQYIDNKEYLNTPIHAE